MDSTDKGSDNMESHEERNTNMAIEQLLALRESSPQRDSSTASAHPQHESAQQNDLSLRLPSNALESLSLLQHGSLAPPPMSGPILERLLLAQQLQQSLIPAVLPARQLQIQQQIELNHLLQQRAALALRNATPLAAQIQPLPSDRNPESTSPIPKASTAIHDGKAVPLPVVAAAGPLLYPAEKSVSEVRSTASMSTSAETAQAIPSNKLPFKKRKALPLPALDSQTSTAPAVIQPSAAIADAAARPSPNNNNDSKSTVKKKRRKSPSTSPQLKANKADNKTGATSSPEIIYDTTDKDVLSVRSRGKGYDPPGNEAFRGIVRKYHDFYLKAKSKTEKNTVISFILDEVKATGARFLKRNDAEGDMANGVSWVHLLPQEEHQKVRDLLIRLCSGKR